MRSRWLAATAVSLLLTAGCGGEDGDDPTVQASPTASVDAAGPGAQGPSQPCRSVPPTQPPRPGTSTDLSEKPEVEGSDEAPPCELVVRDVVVGEGAEVTAGAQVEVRYVGAFYDSGEEFDSSWRISRDQTLPFVAGGGNLIPGFDAGVLGMREGGRREVVIPSEQAYGPAGSGPIPPDATLVFVIDVVSVRAG